MLGRRFWYYAAQGNSVAFGVALGVLVAVAGLASGTTLADDYLDAIEGEAAKLSEDPAVSKEKTSEDAPSTDDPRAAFEKELKDRYRGSYLFYEQLPLRSRQEVFEAHEQGASVKEVRRIILNRFSHSR